MFLLFRYASLPKPVASNALNVVIKRTSESRISRHACANFSDALEHRLMSESAYSTTFKRAMDCPPRQYGGGRSRKSLPNGWEETGRAGRRQPGDDRLQVIAGK
ncbi:hypothetical protein [Chelativorans sp. M5D2P16]|uniref:hypothetical protein n=1 Tax=Chelativorans sp. M5D2P16 TaxID=3095678 RepID=UPI002ACA8C69|nr:hypothetical protein [Chelativorans sp. M5D2P16]MDZ5699785.1 hypothetical protein [Chelativorans sp. M5D2P16]